MLSQRSLARCLTPKHQKRELYFAISQNVPDIVGDLMSIVLSLFPLLCQNKSLTIICSVVYIPTRLLWKIKIPLSKKLALACSLCLTIVVICFTLIRAVAIDYQGNVDNVWEIFWQTVAAEIALILTAMTAFRALYISRARRMPSPGSSGGSSWIKARKNLKGFFTLSRWSRRRMTEEHEDNGGKGRLRGNCPVFRGPR